MEWYLSDHLGSTTLLVDESGLEVERTEYYPYGQVQSGGLEKYGFTGQENDADTGLMYYGARYYSPEYRVFVQPDSIIPYLYNPQSLNRYAYTLNNPVKYTDPSGHEPISATLIAVFILKVTTAVIDYGWTGHDILADMDVISNPNTAVVDRQIAATDITLGIVTEAIEPDEFFIINLPLDDLARKGLMKRIAKYFNDVPEALAKPLFKNNDLLVDHYEKHVLKGKEFGDITIDAYLEGAQNLVTLDAGGDILRKTRSNGDIIHYNKATNEFAVTDKDGNIKTYFKPEDGEDYYNQQK